MQVDDATLTRGAAIIEEPAIPQHRARANRVDQAGNTAVVSVEPAALCSVFGVSDSALASHLLSQLVSVFCSDVTKPADTATINRALALVEGIGPTNASEAMTAVMMVAAQHASIQMLRRAMHPDQSPGGRALYTSLGLKATNTCAKLLEAFNHGRGNGVTQQIIVKRYTVEAGGQAVLGSVDLDRGRG